MKKIKEFLKKIWKKINTDGLIHFLVCFGLAAILSNYIDIGMAVFISIFIGFFKEIIWDAWLKKGTFQWKDLWCDLAGALLVLLILLPKIIIK